MPKYDFVCGDCELQSVYLLHDGDERSVMFECGHCNSRNLNLVAYASNADMHIAILQEQIEELNRRVEYFSDDCEDITDEERARDLMYWN